MNNCPICGQPLKSSHYTGETGHTEEEHDTCPAGCYASGWLYGHSYVEVAGKMFDAEQVDAVQRRIEHIKEHGMPEEKAGDDESPVPF